MGTGTKNLIVECKKAVKYCFLLTAFLLQIKSMLNGSIELPISAMLISGIITIICHSAWMPLLIIGSSVNFVMACKKYHIMLAPTKNNMLFYKQISSIKCNNRCGVNKLLTAKRTKKKFAYEFQIRCHVSSLFNQVENKLKRVFTRSNGNVESTWER